MKVKCVGNLPQYMTKGAAGADLAAQYGYEIEPGQQVMIDTGTKLQLQSGTFGMLVPRSSLCNKQGLSLVNSVGILDEDFTGTIKFCYKNTGDEKLYIGSGERIGQVVIVPYVNADFIVVDTLDNTERGEGGYGSTGK